MCYALYDKDQFHPRILPQELLLRPSFLSSAGQKSRASCDSSVFTASTAREHICPTTTWTAKATWMLKELLWLKEPYSRPWLVPWAQNLLALTVAGVSGLQSTALKHSASTKAALTEVVFWHARREHNSASVIQDSFQHRWVPDFRKWNSVWFPSATVLI